MKDLSSSRPWIVLLFAALPMVFGINVDNALQFRQVVPIGTGPTTSNVATPSPTSTPVSSAAASETSATPTPDASTSASDSSASPSLTPAPSSSISGTSEIITISGTGPSSDSSSSSPITATSDNDATSQASATQASSTNVSGSTGKTVISSTAVTPTPVSSRIQQVITTVVITSGSSTHSSVVTSSALQAVSTSAGSPTLDNGNESSNNSGLEPSQKRIIIGVVVGIGGAILLGGLAVVAWRIWGKRKESAYEDHELMDSQPGSSSLEKRSSVSDNSPFRSTLDQYHHPAGPVNTASNF
ncbi:hypothetical protein MMC07_007971 [Pseudocyphellaria aurata]|nr:hypothetical protein [Pseudocyphellaria aurata]